MPSRPEGILFGTEVEYGKTVMVFSEKAFAREDAGKKEKERERRALRGMKVR